MSLDNQKTISTLNHLIEICRDGDRGYKHAAEHMEEEELRTIFYRLSQQRALFEAELQNEVRLLGGNPEDNGTFKGTLYRAMMEIVSDLSGHKTEAIIKECQGGEKAAMEAYTEALKTELPHYLKEKLNHQFHLIKGAYVQLQEFMLHPH